MNLYNDEMRFCHQSEQYFLEYYCTFHILWPKM